MSDNENLQIRRNRETKPISFKAYEKAYLFGLILNDKTQAKTYLSNEEFAKLWEKLCEGI